MLNPTVQASATGLPAPRLKLPLHEVIWMRLQFRYAMALLRLAEQAEKLRRAASGEAMRISGELLEKIDPSWRVAGKGDEPNLNGSSCNAE
ncbi:hypothetical protein [Methylocapsa aurea]|uniref:hypothetical protein n=1 Tax=Methylocapsa aurea TaxID=663610 RepID=UPI000566A2DE|nr:hypothetical protein [Methylocapsa aurea]